MHYNKLSQEDKDKIDGICMLAAIGRDTLSEALKDGKITQEQHDIIFEKLHDNTKRKICEILLR